MVGALTDQCVESAIRDACDDHFLVTQVDDACQTVTEERQRASVAAVAGYCRQRTTQELLEELKELPASPLLGKDSSNKGLPS